MCLKYYSVTDFCKFNMHEILKFEVGMNCCSDFSKFK